MDDKDLKKVHKSKHKHKKSKHGHKKKKKSRSRSSSAEDGEMEWVEASVVKNTKAASVPDRNMEIKSENKHDDWMNEEMFVTTLSKEDMKSCSSRQKKIEAQNKKRTEEEEIQKARELNPHWKNNGTGLPEEQVQNLALPSTSVGDGGYSYLKKAYYRIMEQSQQEGRSMEEIAVERWGSLDKLISMINESEERMKSNSKSKYNSHKSSRSSHSSTRHDHMHKPLEYERSFRDSPDRNYEYRKPSRDRKDRKLGHFSSKNKKPREREEKYRLDSSDEYSQAAKKDQEIRHESKRPAWKKVKPDSEISIEKQKEENIFVWEKKHFGYDRKTSEFQHPNKKQNPSSSAPSWKKSSSPKKDNEFQRRNVQRSDSDDDSHHSKSPDKNTPNMSITSEDDLNKLAARCTKAELMGDTALYSSLKKQLEEAREALKTGRNVQTSQRTKEKVMLTKIDSSGQERPIHFSDDIKESQSKQRKRQSQKFFDDGSKYSLKQMFEREKLTTVEDNMEMFMEVAAQTKEADDENETSGISKKATNKMAYHLQEEKDVAKAIQQHQKRSAALERCNYCLDQPNMKRHLIVHIGQLIYLCVPDFQSLVDGHCLIVPKRHVASFLALDEEEWREVEELKFNLRLMFQMQDKNIITLETCRSFRYYPHTYIEVIPVPEEISDMAPLYFKKAILESEAEWAINVKLIDLSKKNLQHSVPKNLPYFCVQFDPKLHAGYAHVIEDENNFERNFGKEVIGGMLDIDYNYLFKNRKEDQTKKSKETIEFVKKWNTFNNVNS